MREEALNTNDNYQHRSWLEDKRSTLRYQPVKFIESGLLSNKLSTPSSTENDVESSHENELEVPETDTLIVEETVISIQTEQVPSHPSLSMDDVSSTKQDSFQNDTDSISRFHGSDTISDSLSNSKPILSSLAVPLPPVQFISTEENIVFTPRNQRRQPNAPTTNLSNWEVPATFKAMTESSSPDWTKPRKKQNKRGGHKQFKIVGDEEEEIIEFVSPVLGLPMTVTAEDALRDYLENIRAQGDDSDEEYIDGVLAEAGVSDEMEKLTIEERRSRSVEIRGIDRRIERVALSESATPLRLESPEGRGPVNSVVSHDSEVEMEGFLDDAWIMNRSSKSDSEDGSDAFQGQEDVVDDPTDPIWNTDSEEPSKSKGKENQLSSDNEDEEEDDDDDDVLLDEDEDIIANMLLDDYNLDGLDFDLLPAHFSKKSLTRQPNVPTLPSADEDIAEHLQSLWKRDRESKKQRKADREKARLQGLLGNKSKSKGKNAKRSARQQELERTEGESLAIDMRQINEEIRNFWGDDDATEYTLSPSSKLIVAMRYLQWINFHGK
jgi:hypothetical protein